jgi:hypothetical protein
MAGILLVIRNNYRKRESFYKNLYTKKNKNKKKNKKLQDINLSKEIPYQEIPKFSDNKRVIRR